MNGASDVGKTHVVMNIPVCTPRAGKSDVVKLGTSGSAGVSISTTSSLLVSPGAVWIKPVSSSFTICRQRQQPSLLTEQQLTQIITQRRRLHIDFAAVQHAPAQADGPDLFRGGGEQDVDDGCGAGAHVGGAELVQHAAFAEEARDRGGVAGGFDVGHAHDAAAGWFGEGEGGGHGIVLVGSVDLVLFAGG
jgi:hypothetical protein